MRRITTPSSVFILYFLLSAISGAATDRAARHRRYARGRALVAPEEPEPVLLAAPIQHFRKSRKTRNFRPQAEIYLPSLHQTMPR